MGAVGESQRLAGTIAGNIIYTAVPAAVLHAALDDARRPNSWCRRWCAQLRRAATWRRVAAALSGSLSLVDGPAARSPIVRREIRSSAPRLDFDIARSAHAPICHGLAIPPQRARGAQPVPRANAEARSAVSIADRDPEEPLGDAQRRAPLGGQRPVRGRGRMRQRRGRHRPASAQRECPRRRGKGVGLGRARPPARS